MKKEILFLEPILKECVWGGSRLTSEYPYTPKQDGIGECWAVSAHPHGDCRVKKGKWKGMSLSGLYKEHKDLFGNLSYEEFPLLVKIIDAKSDLSIQVHPDDTYARERENVPFGKTECWYILDCPEDAYLVVGHKAKTREELADMIYRDQYEELIRRVKVNKGDMIQIDPGTIHAICGGFLILETQQNSDITYRVYDYHRLVDGKPRPLHVEQSIQVINVPDESDRNAILPAREEKKNERVLLTESDYYKVWKLWVEGECTFRMEESFLIGSVVEGSGRIEEETLEKGSHFLLPHGYGEVKMQGNMTVIFSCPLEKTKESNNS